MQRRQFLIGTMKHSLLGAAACSVSGCGTIFHSERVGQMHSRDIDWKIAALDGLGLLLFFVPGVIAFVVDFYTGAIYLPPEGMEPYPYSGPPQTSSSSRSKTRPSQTSTYPHNDPAQNEPLTRQEQRLRRIEVSRQSLQPRQIEEVVARETGCKISLNDVDSRLSVLPGIDHYDEQLARHRHDRNFGQSVKDFFSRIMTS